jgi:hypothetical protein
MRKLEREEEGEEGGKARRDESEIRNGPAKGARYPRAGLRVRKSKRVGREDCFAGPPVWGDSEGRGGTARVPHGGQGKS